MTHTRLKLPNADEFGNYWFGGAPGKLPAILPQKDLVITYQNQQSPTRDVVYTGRFSVLVSEDEGFLTTERGQRELFDDVKRALRALNDHLDTATRIGLMGG